MIAAVTNWYGVAFLGGLVPLGAVLGGWLALAERRDRRRG